MPRNTIEYVTIAPDCPGDVVCSRYLLSIVSRQGHSAVVVPKKLSPLLMGINVEIFSYSNHPCEVADVVRARTSPNTQIYDLLCYEHSGALCQKLGLYCVGVPDPVSYDREVVWNLTTNDPTHYAVRLLRYLPTQTRATAFQPAQWLESSYPVASVGSPPRIALAPGCGRENPSKRWLAEGWARIAGWASANSIEPIWFLGPDESELIDDLVSSGGSVVSGDWTQVILAHAQCQIGLTNDTVHLHLRAHLPVLTLGLFFTSSVDHWGAYPSRVEALQLQRNDLDELSTIQVALKRLLVNLIC